MVFFDNEHYEDFLLSIWSQNTEFAHRHTLPVSVSPGTPFVTLGHISLHPACPEPPVSSFPKSSFSGTHLAFCPGNYGPRSRHRGPNSQLRQRKSFPVGRGSTLSPAVSNPSPVFSRDPSPVRQGTRHPEPSSKQAAAELQGSEDTLKGRVSAGEKSDGPLVC